MTHEFDLKIERTMKAPRAALWRCWTEPELLKQWFCPKPWYLERAEFDLRAGGNSLFVMRGPNGESHVMPGCWLEITPMSRLVFTDAYTGGFVPAGKPFMTGVSEFADAPGGGTKYTATARHWTAEDMKRHEEMGFHAGWNAATDQLEALALSLR